MCEKQHLNKDSLNSMAHAPWGLSRSAAWPSSSPGKAGPLLQLFSQLHSRLQWLSLSLSIKLQSSFPSASFKGKNPSCFLWKRKRYFFILNKLSRTLFNCLCTIFPLLKQLYIWVPKLYLSDYLTLLLVQIMNSFQSISSLNRTWFVKHVSISLSKHHLRP